MIKDSFVAEVTFNIKVKIGVRIPPPPLPLKMATSFSGTTSLSTSQNPLFSNPLLSDLFTFSFFYLFSLTPQHSPQYSLISCNPIIFRIFINMTDV